MKKSTINIIALLIFTSLFLGGIYTSRSSYKLRISIDKTIQKNAQIDIDEKVFNLKIESIYQLASSNLGSTLHEIQNTRIRFPKKSTELDYIEARVLLMHNELVNAPLLLDRLKKVKDSPKFIDVYNHYLIKNGEVEFAEKHLNSASYRNDFYKYQLANLYEIKAEVDIAINLYNELIASNSFLSENAIKRKEALKNGPHQRLINIELGNDSKRRYIPIGKLNMN